MMFVMLRELLHEISIWIVILPVIAGIVNYKGLNRDSRWIFLLVCIALVPQVLTAIFRQERPLLNLSYNIYTPIEFSVLYLLFNHKYREMLSEKIKKTSLFLYVAVCGFFFLKYGLIFSFLGGLVAVNNLIYICWILMLLKEQYHQEDPLIHKNNPFAWYLLALIIYAPCTIILFCLYHYIRAQDPAMMNLWTIQSLCNILLYLLFTVGLYLRKNGAKKEARQLI